ncbi:PREDICTED: putative dynamin-related protein 4A [Camelina sativa]|uniref:Dynamin-related protein 4A n=1 Tax=Camelina sativa TaxID=90675 RepID=A0ABM0ZBN2_CAMSA|nr:PREDICTED: putative dynamin-related protein 4A [Camelina sativa]
MSSPSLAEEHDFTDEAPIVSPNNDHLHNIVEGLSNLNLGREGIQRPTIVLVGGHGYGMSSVLESLTRLSFRGKGQSTRVPLVVKLQKSSNPVPEIYLEYKGKNVPTDEEHIANAIGTATDEIAGSGERVSDIPLTLHVKKADVLDLTLVDLPGLRVPVDRKISKILKKFIKPEESIILNVLSATVDFTTCESIRMSRQVDKTGERTLSVVSKADMAPEGLLQKVTADDVSIGLGYVCVRNRIGDESFDEARKEEELLFSNHPLLSVINKNIVGIPVLADKLKQIQDVMISRLAAKPPLRRSTRSKFLNPYLR